MMVAIQVFCFEKNKAMKILGLHFVGVEEFEIQTLRGRTRLKNIFVSNFSFIVAI